VERPRIRAVVAGRRDDPTLLRLALERDGIQVLGEARSVARLIRIVEAEHPDVVVLTDGLGPNAPAALRTLEPPPILVAVTDDPSSGTGADGRVATSAVLRDLVPEVIRVRLAAAEALRERPAWVARVHKDPRALRADRKSVV